MNHFLHCVGLASLLAFPTLGFAQDVTEPEPNPVETALTISFDVVDPAPGPITTAMPLSFKLDFSGSSLNPKSIVDNTNFSATAPSVAGGDYSFSGKYAYLYIGDSWENWTSAPLSATVNADMTVTLSLDLSQTPSFAQVYNNPGLFTTSLIIPENLFTVSATNINNSLNDYESLPVTIIFEHVGDYQFATPVIDPANESTIERVSELKLAFNPSVSGDIKWVCDITDNYATSFQKLENDVEYYENGSVSSSFADEADPSSASLRVRPALSNKGQYRIDIPMGVYTMIAMKNDGSDEVVAKFTNPSMSLRYAVGMEVANGLPKSTILASVTPEEGNINLEQIPSGVDYLQLVFTSIPVIDRTLNENIQLFYNNGTTPLKEVSPSNQTYLRLQTQGIANDYEHVLHLYIDGENDIVMPGDYTVVFPEGLFLFGDSKEPSARMVLNYHIDKQLVYTTIPHDQISLNVFDEVDVVFNNAQKVEINPAKSKDITVETLSGSVYGVISEVTVENKIARIHMPQAYTGRGVYKITIPEAYFLVTVDDEVLSNQPIERQWYIKELPLPSIEPAEGVLASNQLFEVTLDVGEDNEISAVNDNAFTRLLRVDDNGDFVYKPEVSYFKVDMPENSVGGTYVTLIPDSERAITLAPGNYVFIPAAYIYTLKGGAMSGEYFYFWTVLPNLPELMKPVVTPNEFVDSSAMFTMTFAESDMIKTISKDKAYLYPLNENGTVGEMVASYNAVKGATPNEIDLVNTKEGVQLETGIYTLRTPKGICWTSDAMAAAYDFTIYYGMESGVTEILGTASDLYDVFSINGMKVLEKAPASALGGLTPGIYVVNGKKIVIK